MRRKLGRNEQDLAKLKSFDRAFSDGDMTAMDGIEGTAKEGDVHAKKCKWKAVVIPNTMMLAQAIPKDFEIA